MAKIVWIAGCSEMQSKNILHWNNRRTIYRFLWVEKCNSLGPSNFGLCLNELARISYSKRKICIWLWARPMKEGVSSPQRLRSWAEHIPRMIPQYGTSFPCLGPLVRNTDIINNHNEPILTDGDVKLINSQRQRIFVMTVTVARLQLYYMTRISSIRYHRLWSTSVK